MSKGEVVVQLDDRRPKVWYTVSIGQGWDDSLEVCVQDVADDLRSRKAIARALRRAAYLIEKDE